MFNVVKIQSDCIKKLVQGERVMWCECEDGIWVTTDVYSCYYDYGNEVKRMNVTNYFKKHGFIFGLDIDTDPITVKIFSDMETAVNWSKTGKILCGKSIAVLYSNRIAINQLINSVKTQDSV